MQCAKEEHLIHSRKNAFDFTFMIRTSLIQSKWFVLAGPFKTEYHPNVYLWVWSDICVWGNSVDWNVPRSWAFVEKATKLFSQDSNEEFYWFQWCVL